MVKLDRSVKEVKDIKQTLIQRIITLESGLNKWMQKIDLGHTGKRTQSVMEETHDNFSSSIFRNKSQISEEKEVKKGVKNKSMNSPNKKSFMVPYALLN